MPVLIQTIPPEPRTPRERRATTSSSRSADGAGSVRRHRRAVRRVRAHPHRRRGRQRRPSASSTGSRPWCGDPFPLLYRRALVTPSAGGHRPWWFPPEAHRRARGARSLGLAHAARADHRVPGLAAHPDDHVRGRRVRIQPGRPERHPRARCGSASWARWSLTALADRQRPPSGAAVVRPPPPAWSTAVSAWRPSLVALGRGQIGRSAGSPPPPASCCRSWRSRRCRPARARSGSACSAVTGALGVGLVLMALPLADTSQRGWRIIYLVPLLLLLVARADRAAHSRRAGASRWPTPTSAMAGHGRRFWLLGAVGVPRSPCSPRPPRSS